MRSKITLFAVAMAAVFTSCSKEANFTNSGTSFGGYHKTETQATAQTISTTNETTLTASTEAQPAIANQTVAFTAPKVTQTGVAKTETAEAAVATAAKTMTKKEVKAVAKEIKKEVKKNKKGLAADGKSQVIALILALVVGVIGVHRFYLGYTGIGIAQIFTLGGCGIWTLIDIVRIITGDLQPKDGSYEKTL